MRYRHCCKYKTKICYLPCSYNQPLNYKMFADFQSIHKVLIAPFPISIRPKNALNWKRLHIIQTWIQLNARSRCFLFISLPIDFVSAFQKFVNSNHKLGYLLYSVDNNNLYNNNLIYADMRINQKRRTRSIWFALADLIILKLHLQEIS